MDHLFITNSDYNYDKFVEDFGGHYLGSDNQ